MGDNCFIRVCCNRARGSGFKLKEGRFRLSLRKKVLIRKVMKHWQRFLREMVEAPSLETFQARLDEALSNQKQLKMSLTISGGEVGQTTLKIPSNSNIL